MLNALTIDYPSMTPWKLSRPKILSQEKLPDIDDLITEDDTPVDSIFAEKQQRLLTELYGNWPGPANLLPGRSFRAMANVGLFYSPKESPLVPDMMLSVNVIVPKNIKEKRSYFTWVYGKPPDVVIEIISDHRGGEKDKKLKIYASNIGVPYYVILDPYYKLSNNSLLVYHLHGHTYLPQSTFWLADVELGLMLWQGRYEDEENCWLRWIDKNGNLIPTGAERANQERQRANQEQQRANQEQQRANQEWQRAEQAHAQSTRLAAKLRELGIDPDI